LTCFDLSFKTMQGNHWTNNKRCDLNLVLMIQVPDFYLLLFIFAKIGRTLLAQKSSSLSSESTKCDTIRDTPAQLEMFGRGFQSQVCVGRVAYRFLNFLVLFVGWGAAIHHRRSVHEAYCPTAADI
jgi:hypothetical protein